MGLGVKEFDRGRSQMLAMLVEDMIVFAIELSNDALFPVFKT